MPVLANASADGAPLSEQDAEAHIHGISFKTGPPAKVGAELEWLVRKTADPAGPVDYQRVCEILRCLDTPGALPGGGSLTREPGGQIEISTAPAVLGECVAAANRDLAVVRQALRPAGLALHGMGLDSLLPPRRVLDLPRYAAMEDYFGRRGPWGSLMMCSTAAVQVSVDAGTAGTGTASYRVRWRLLHALSPVLVAMFANSPLRGGRPTGWKSTRQLVWSRIDPCRTRPPAGAVPSAGAGLAAAAGNADPAQAWVSYALDAELMCLRRPAGQPWTAAPGLTFRAWLRGAGERRPTSDDLCYHLSTLFPPVRPRGHFELRVIDAQPGDGWIVPTAVVQALLDDPVAADAAFAATEPLWQHMAAARRDGRPAGPRPAAAASGTGRGQPEMSWPGADLWRRAARLGLADPELAAAAGECIEAADAALARSGTAAAIRQHVSDFAERYALRGRCPADDLLEERT